MKAALIIARIIVGLLFIFSGLVKANDPLGLSYKMQEFFEIWGITQFNGHTLWMSIVMNAFEIIAGAALLLGWKMRLFSWLLLLLILFFTFLTGYAYLSGKFKNCGCFGDCIPITPFTSFIKDIALTLLIGFIFWQRKNIKPLFSRTTSAISLMLVAAVSFGIQWYTLSFLPVFDCLPFRKGNHIPTQMQIPQGAVPDSFAIVFVYEKDGKEYEFLPTGFPDDLSTYKFVKRTDKLIRKGNAEPPLKSFSLSGITDIDSTQTILDQDFAILLFIQDFSTPVSSWQDEVTRIYNEASLRNIPMYAVTNRLSEAVKHFSATPLRDIPVMKCDFTAIRTAARTNPTIFLLQKGTVIGKWSHRRSDQVVEKIQTLVVPEPELPQQEPIPPPIDTPKIK